jgi:prevent-host-death family protein
MQATAKDLRFHTKELLESISRGEEVVITYRGKPHAKLVPIYSEVENDYTINPLRGIWKEHKESEDVNAYIDELRKGRGYDR